MLPDDLCFQHTKTDAKEVWWWCLGPRRLNGKSQDVPSFMEGSGLIKLADNLPGTSVIASSDWGPRDNLARGDLQPQRIRHT